MSNYCRDCKWWCGDRSSIGIRCMNTNRRIMSVGKQSRYYKPPYAYACKSGFEPKEENNE